MSPLNLICYIVFSLHKFTNAIFRSNNIRVNVDWKHRRSAVHIITCFLTFKMSAELIVQLGYLGCKSQFFKHFPAAHLNPLLTDDEKVYVVMCPTSHRT